MLLPEGVERLMQVPDTMRKAVVFLYCNIKEEELPIGTAFFVSYPVPGTKGNNVGGLVTAHHILAKARKRSKDGKIVIRANLLEGGAGTYTTHIDDWLHLDTKIDCAMLPLRLLYDQFVGDMRPDYASWSLKQDVAVDRVIQTQGIGIGEDIFMVGLFRNHLGRDRNEPILRVGNIAAIPSDSIPSPYGDMRVILIEARSIGGLSGSPVFVNMGMVRWREGKLMQSGSETQFLFLGLMHGHWDIDSSQIDALTDDTEKLNTGIAIVVPAQQVTDSIVPYLKKEAKMQKEKLDKESMPTLDSSIDDDNEFDLFDDLARKVVQVPKSEIDEKRKK
jgi:hypothetical protein